MKKRQYACTWAAHVRGSLNASENPQAVLGKGPKGCGIALFPRGSGVRRYHPHNFFLKLKRPYIGASYAYKGRKVNTIKGNTLRNVSSLNIYAANEICRLFGH